eukprot:g19220.t1
MWSRRAYRLPWARLSAFRCCGNETLRSSGRSNVAQLAASIKLRLLSEESCAIDCLGPEAIFRSLRAMHLAMVFARRERAIDQTLCLTPEERGKTHTRSDQSVARLQRKELGGR